MAEESSALAELLRGRSVVVLSGAGMSTDSGIPDYRGAGRLPRHSIQHADFLKHEAVRRRYWARAFIGWERFRGASPNAAHFALAELEQAGRVRGLITQNVDRLHTRAGSREVIELHGALARVRCLGCGAIEPREAVQARLGELNPGVSSRSAALAPDGDAEVAAELALSFVVAPCVACGGTLKPDVVFFGDNVPRPTVDAAMAWVDGSDALLVLGTSLAVFSGMRFVRRAAERGLPIAIVNRGPTRGDPLAQLRLDAPLGEVLPALAAALSRR